MVYSSRPLPSHLRQPSTSGNLNVSTGQSPLLQARINEKKAELENLKQLRDLSAGLAGQMQMLEEKLATLSDGTEAVATVLGNWHSVLRAISMASMKIPKPKEAEEQGEDTEKKEDIALPQTLVRIPMEHAPMLEQATGGEPTEEITRSKAIQVVEDDTALAMEIPLPDTPEPAVLYEVNYTGLNSMPSLEDDPDSMTIKGLKAAYRSAIGMNKKGKKGKNKKKGGKQAAVPDGPEGVLSEGPVIEDNESSTSNSATEGARQLLHNCEGRLYYPFLDSYTPQDLTRISENILGVVSEERALTPPSPAVRATRRQLAKQLGQSEAVDDALGTDLKSAVEKRQRDVPFLSLFAGRQASSSRAASTTIHSRNSQFNRTVTDSILSLAEMGKTNKKTTADMDQMEIDTCRERALLAQSAQGFVRSTASPTRSPAKTLDEVERVCKKEQTATPIFHADEDSFIEQIISRSPAKFSPRIEDSVEALDQLEEAIEAALANKILPVEEVKMGPAPTQNSKAKPKPKTGSATMRVKSTAPRQSVLKKSRSMTFKTDNRDDTQTSFQSGSTESVPAKKVPVKRPNSLLPPKQTVRSLKPVTRPTFELPGEAVARQLKEKREARIAQQQSNEETVVKHAPSVSAPKIKSTKPPTKPAFELPGEAISRKKREAQKARLKAQEEDDQKRRQFKATPLRNVVPSTLPRETIASRARQSKIGIEGIENGNLSVAKRGSNVGAHRPSILQINKANISAPRSPGTARPTARQSSFKLGGTSISGLAMQRTVSVTEAQVQRQRAKEIYNRDMKLAEEIEREKREREAAAKRSREEAAERGRQASREWAEKQRAKKLTEGDKGMSAGFGPGGQMGLKS
ncbi:hypothetical protein B7494_g6912 [Chlorociboria aeruginascens]|nr:hypothetical protein B7494_g6912 [Chlorociboria aeruginascens]